ncbi:Ig-like domain-containing protein [Neisseriaceae bacterium TC5R-5]|nr:Ig-like domain-containing protein [Neisseriaceae bacterium TC5R-5]
MALSIIVVDKLTHAQQVVSQNVITLHGPSVAQIPFSREQLLSAVREGDALVITTKSGETLRLEGFFSLENGRHSELVLQDNGQLWQAQFDNLNQLVVDYAPLDTINPLLIAQPFELSAASVGLAIGGAGVAGAALGGGGGGAVAAPVPVPAPVVPLPVASVTISAISPDTGSSSSDFITNRHALLIHVTVNQSLQSGEKVQVSLDNGSNWHDASLLGGTTYTYDNSAQPLADGSYLFVARVVNAAGQAGASHSQTVVIDSQGPTSANSVAISSYTDDVGPQVGDYGSGSSTNDSAPLLKGTVSGLNSGEVVQVYQGSILLGNATVNGSSWTYQLSSLADGNHNYHVVITDLAGNQGSSSANFSFIEDTGAVNKVAVLSSISLDAGVSGNDFVTNDNQLVFHGTLNTVLGAGQTVRVLLDNGLGALTATVSGTSWTLDNSAAPLGDGTYHVQVWVQDAAGNQGVVSSQDVVIGTVAPVQSITLAAINPDSGTSNNDFVTNSNALIFSGSLGGSLASDQLVQLSLDGGGHWQAVSVSGTSWSYDSAALHLADGRYNVIARVVDTAGNVGSMANQTVVLDTQPPLAGNSVSLTSYTDAVAPQLGNFLNNSSTNDTQPQLNGTVNGLSAGDVVQIYQNGNLLGNAQVSGNSWFYQISSPLSEGSYSYRAVITDLAGNQGTRSGNFVFSVDTTVPASSETVSLSSITTDSGLSPSDFITSDNSLLFSGQLGAPLALGERVEISLDGGTTWRNSIVSGQNWSYNNQGQTLADGNYDVQLRVIDAAGNVGQQGQQTVIVDTVAPNANTTISIRSIDSDTGYSSSDFITADNTLVFNGRLGAALGGNETVQISLDNGVSWQLASVNGTIWSYDNSASALADGAHTVRVRVIDSAGNVGQSSSQVVMVDSSIPPSNSLTITGISADTGFSNNDFITNDNTLVFSGVLKNPLSANQLVQISLDHGTTWLDATTSGTSWSYDNTADALGDGIYTLNARITDLVGNIIDNVSQDITQIKTTPPSAAETVQIIGITRDSGSSSSDFITNDDALVISGTVGVPLAAGDGVEISLDGGSSWQVATVNGTNWSYDNTRNHLTPGSYTILARVVDIAGNIGQSSSQALLIDNSAPLTTATISAIARDTGTSSSDFITNDNTLLVSATLNTALGGDETVQISLDGGNSWQNASLLSGNTYQLDNSSNVLTDGNYVFAVRIVDIAGNASPIATQRVLVDTSGPTSGNSVAINSYTDHSAPQTGNFGSNTFTNDSSPQLNGTVGGLNSGDVVEIYQGSTLLGNATMSGGSWHYQIGTTLSDGNYSYRAVIADAAGNEGTSSSHFDFIVLTAPSATSASIDAVSIDAGSSSSDFITSQNRLNFSGTLSNTLVTGENVQISLDGGSSWRVAIVSGTNWTYNNTGNQIADGSYTIQARVVNGAGLVGTVASQSLLVDTLPPSSTETVQITDLSPDNGPSSSDFITNSNQLVFNGTTGIPLASGDSVQISLDNGTSWLTASASGTSWSYDNSANILADGSYTLRARVVDTAGNVGQTASQLISIDTLPPSASATITLASITQDTGLSSLDFITNDNRLVFNGNLGSTLNASDRVQISLDGGGNWQQATVSGNSWSYDNSANILADGSYNVLARVIDLGGNIGQNTSKTIVVDTLPPDSNTSVSINNIVQDSGASSSDFITNANRLLFNGSLSNTLAAGETVQISLDNGTSWQNATISANSWSYNNSSNALADGSYTLRARVIDAAGNIGQSTQQALVIDSAAPAANETITVDSITRDTGISGSDFISNDHTLLYRGSLGAPLQNGESVQLSIDGGSSWQTASVSGTSWSYDGTSQFLADAGYTVQVRVIDTAGNIGQSASHAILIDSVAPSPSETINIAAISQDTGSNGGDFITSDNTLTFSGVLGTPLAAGELVQISLDNGANWRTASTSGVNWSYDNSASTLADGSYNVLVRVSDIAGNIGQTANQTVIVNSGAPSASTTVTIDGITRDNGLSASDFVTNDHTLLFNGTLGGSLAADEVLQISLNGGTTWQVATVSGTSWSYDNTASSLADSSYQFIARVINNAGGVGQTATQTVVIDSAAPTASVSISAITQDNGSSSSDFVTNDNSLLINVTASGPLGSGEVVQISLDNGNTWQTASHLSGNNYQLNNTANPLADGSYTLAARISDTAGNTSATVNQIIVIDTQAPTSGNSVTITDYSDNVSPQTGSFASGSSSNDTTPLLNGTVTGLGSGEVIQIYQGSTLLGNATITGNSWSYQLSALSNGSNNSYYAVISDSAGNQGTASNIFNINIDTTAPTSTPTISSISTDTGSSSSDFITSDNTLLLQGNLSAPLGSGETVQVRLNSGLTPLTATVTGSSWSLDNTADVLSDGTYSVQVWVQDAAGNTGTAVTQNVVIDSQAPNNTISLNAISPDTGASSTDFITGNSHLLFSGSLGSALGSGESVQISLDNGSTWRNATASATTWSYNNSASTLADGSYTVLARIVDTAGNATPSASQLVVVDTAAPLTGNSVAISSYTDTVSPQQGNFGSSTSTNDNVPVLNGTVSGLGVGEFVQIYQGSTLLGNASVSGNSWTYQIGSPLADNSYTYRAVITDTAGNQGSTPANFSFIVDTQAPGANKTVTLSSITSDSGVSLSDFITSDQTLIFSGTLGAALSSNESVQISLDNGVTWQNATASGTTWSADNTANPLSDGNYDVQIRVVDAAGNIGQSTHQTVQIDSIAPTENISIRSISQDTGLSSSDFITADNTLVFNGRLSSALSNGEFVQISLDNGSTWNSATVSGAAWSYDNTANILADGNYDVIARVIDTAGNIGQSASQTVTISSAATSVNSLTIDAISQDTGPSSSDFITNDNTLIFSGSLLQALTASQHVEISLDNGSSWQVATVSGTSWSYDNTANPLGDGSYTLDARIIDTAGNVVDNLSRDLALIKTSPPSAAETIQITDISRDTGSSSSDYITGDNTLVFSGTLGTTLATYDAVQISLDGGVSWHLATVNGTSWSYDNTANVMADGSYNVQARVIDLAGNIGQSTSQTVVIDTSTPVASAVISSISQDTGTSSSDFISSDNTLQINATLSGSLGSGEKVQISLDGGNSWQDAALLSANTYQLDNTATPLADGNYQTLARVVDVAGNATTSSTQRVIIDTSAPSSGNSVAISSYTDNVGPQLGNYASNSFTNDDTPQLNGTVGGLSSGDVVQIYQGVTLLGLASVSGSSWSYQLAGGLSDGNYSYRAVITDAAGNQGTASSNFSVNILTVAPTTSVAISAVSPDTGSSSSDFITSQNRLTFNGTLSSVLGTSESVQISLDGGSSWQTASVSGSNWSYNNTANALASGNYLIAARVINGSGLAGSQVSQALTVDTTAPIASTTLTAISPDTGSSSSDFVTSANHLLINTTLNGSLGAGESVQISVDGGASWNTASLLTGSTYQLNNTAATLADGSYSFQSRVVDTAGNASAVSSRIVTIDTQAPTSGNSIAISSYTDNVFAQTGDFANNSSSNDTTPLLNGTVSGLAAGDIVQVYQGATLLGNATVSGGSWSYQVNSALSDGSYSYRAVITDAAGNQGSTSTNFTLTVDTVAPSNTETISIGAITPDTGLSNSDFITNNNAIVFSGALGTSLAAGEKAQISLDGGSTWLDSTISGLSWSYNNTASPLSDGVYNIKARIVDDAGNQGRTSNQIVVIDTLAPGVSETVSMTSITQDTGSSSSDFITSDNTLIFNGSLGSTLLSGEYVQVSLDGGSSWNTATTTGSSWSYNYSATPLADGNYTVQARVIDTAGNIGQSTSQLVVVDTVAPNNTISIGPITVDSGTSSSDYITSDNRLLFQGTLNTPVPAGGGVQFSVDGGSTFLLATVSGTSWSYDYTGTALPDGNYNIKVRVFDAAGNIGNTANQTLVIDTTTPSQIINITAINSDTGSSNSDFNTSDTTLQFSGTLNGNLGSNDYVQISLDGGSTWNTAVSTGSSWSYDNSGNVLASGSYNVIARVADLSGNIGNSSSRTVVVDTSAPLTSGTINAISPDSGTSSTDFITSSQNLTISVTLSGALASGESVQISLNGGGSWQTATLVSGNTYQLNNTANTLAAGTYTFQTRVIDLAGNAGSVSSQTVVINTSGPAVSSIALSAVSTDTSASVSSGTTSTTNISTNTDLNTRASALTVSGTYIGNLTGSDVLQISSNGGSSWANASFNNSNRTWTYTDPTARIANVSYLLRTMSLSGALGAATASQTINVLSSAPVQSLLAPILALAYDSAIAGDYITTNTSFTFNSSQNRVATAGNTIALINDINRDGIYSEGIDSILSSSTVAANGSWSLNASGLSSGSYNLAFMQFDTAGNRSSLSASKELDIVSADNSALSATSWGSSYGLYYTAAAVTIGSNGLWSFGETVSGSATFNIYNSTGLNSYSIRALTPSVGEIQNNITFADFTRSGYAGVAAAGTDTSHQDFWSTTDGVNYTLTTLLGNSLFYGGIAAYDKTGTGYLGFVLGDNYGDSISFVTNNHGVLSWMNGTPTSGEGRPTGVTFNGFAELSAVDVDSNGTVDVAQHTTALDQYSLTILKNDQSSSTAFSGFSSLAGVFHSVAAGNSNIPVSMTWGDFNNDGYVDLYLNIGRNSANNADTNLSRLYWNNGSGGFGTSPGTTAGTATYFTDTIQGGASLAIDWNHDGLMDIIKSPAYGTSGTLVWYQNLGNANFAATASLTGNTAFSTINGALAADYNWDGAVDVLLYQSTGPTQFIQNTNTVQYGSSLHLRILDPNGINIYYGNIVELFDSSGTWVASQIINPQAGVLTNDGSALVNFYGLDANQSYTAVLLDRISGTAQNVGGLASMGGVSVQNVNTAWTNLTPGAATSAHILSAEAGSNNANAKFIGTGYNDTFYATQGSDSYNGSGGWSDVLYGSAAWSASGGVNIVDFSLAGSTAISVNLNTVGAQSTGYNTATLTNIQGLRGGSGNDSFTASTTAGVNNLFEGRGGNDSFNLSGAGGHVRLVYNLLNSSDTTGGNGSDTASGFVLGNLSSSATSDVIDLSKLLSSYQGTAYVYKDAISGNYVLDSASQGLNNYLQVSNSSGNTVISVDLGGSGNFSAGHTLLTLSGVSSNLATLLANNQLLVAAATPSQFMTVNSQITTNTTPIISGTLPSSLPSGGYIEVMINGVTYSSATGAVVIDPNNNSWYVQTTSALSSGSYNVSATLFGSNGGIVSYDRTASELQILSAPSGTTTVNGESANITAPGMVVGDINNDGLFDYFNASSIYTQSASNAGNLNRFGATSLYTEQVGGIGKISSAQLLDISRNGHPALMMEQSYYPSGSYYFTTSGSASNISYTRVNYSSGTAVWWGGQVAIDLNNDGYVDLVSGDKYGDSAGYSLNNKNDTLTGYNVLSSADPLTLTINGSIGEDTGAFDLNGDGRVDLLGQFFGGSYGGSASSLAVLLTGAGGATSALAASTAAGTLKTTSNVLYHQDGAGDWNQYQGGIQTMNVADFNGDGKLDLFLGQTNAGATASAVYTSDGAGNFTLATTLSTSTIKGGISINTDWNADGKLDVFEFPDNGSTSPTLNNQTGFEYWQNSTTTAGAAPTFIRTLMSVSSISTATGIISAVAADFNYDGSQDLIINTNGADVFIANTNAVAPKTSLHLKIEDPAGYNTYESQTVNLYNASGTLVASRVLNGQYGYGFNDSRGIVDFYGLSSGQSYTAVLVKGAVSGIDGSYGTITGNSSHAAGTVNTTWGGLAADDANHAYVLVATASGDSTTGNFIGTGYNDTFFASAGTNTYNGSGGWDNTSGSNQWSNAGGNNTVDYTLAGSSALTIDLSNSTAQNTGFNTATFTNIHGIAGGAGNDTFTDSSGNDQFEGRGGNDTFNLTHGGHDSLIYNALLASATGGNGSDIVNGFKVGTWEGTTDTPRIDIHSLLSGVSGFNLATAASYVNGVATLGAGVGNITNYLQVTQSGADTLINIDRDGSGNTYSSTTLLTLHNVHTDLATLLANHQLVVV